MVRKKHLRLAVRGACLLCGVIVGFTTYLIRAVETQHIRGAVSSHLPPSAASAAWPHPFLHIINTRFQQQQPNLKALGRARLILFETFCLNSIVKQTLLNDVNGDVPPFLWIIKVDPHLSFDLLGDLVNLVSPYPFIYVVASNVNFGVGQHPGGWRGGEAGRDVLNSVIYSGNLTILQQAHMAREERAVLETRVDADDGLHAEYLENIQSSAKKKLAWEKNRHPEKRRWMYWCSLNHVDWTPTMAGVPLTHAHFGVFVPKKSPHICITAGITLGFAVGVKERQVPRFMHHQLVNELRYMRDDIDCGGVNNTKCLQMVGNPALGAIRSRTSTSAGMRGVLTNEEAFERRIDGAVGNNATLLSVLLFKEFHCQLDKVSDANRYLREHTVEIVQDNLKGQCTKGHSCKTTTKEALHDLLKSHTELSMKGRHEAVQ